MAKNRKTKKEKIRTVTRAQTVSTPVPSHDTPSQNTGVFTFVSQTTQTISKQSAGTISVSYLRDDLLRTVTVITSILLAEITLWFILTGK